MLVTSVVVLTFVIAAALAGGRVYRRKNTLVGRHVARAHTTAPVPPSVREPRPRRFGTDAERALAEAAEDTFFAELELSAPAGKHFQR